MSPVTNEFAGPLVFQHFQRMPFSSSLATFQEITPDHSRKFLSDVNASPSPSFRLDVLSLVFRWFPWLGHRSDAFFTSRVDATQCVNSQILNPCNTQPWMLRGPRPLLLSPVVGCCQFKLMAKSSGRRPVLSWRTAKSKRLAQSTKFLLPLRVNTLGG